MGSAPFHPPSSDKEVVDQLRRLWRKFKAFEGVKPATGSTVLDDKVNEILALLRAVVGP